MCLNSNTHYNQKWSFFRIAKFYNIIRHSYNTMQNSPDYGRSHGAIFFSFTGCFHEICCCYNWWLNDFHRKTLRQSFVKMNIRDWNEVNKPFILLQQIATAYLVNECSISLFFLNVLIWLYFKSMLKVHWF